METFLIFIGALILLVNLILIFRVIYTYTKVWVDRHTSLQTKKLNTNYKEVANKAFEDLLTNQLTVSVALKFNSPTSPITYEEKHTIHASDIGDFSIQIGKGKITKGSYNTLVWGEYYAFMKISVNENHHHALHGDYSSALVN